MDQLDNAISKAQHYLVSHQYHDGYWQGDLVSNPTIESEHIMLTTYLGVVDERQQGKIVNYLWRKQLSDGSWSIYEGGEGDLSTTVECYFALKLAGEDIEDDRMKKAKEFILAQGGVPRARVFTKIWLSLFGIWDWDRVPQMPPELIYLPSWFPFNVYDFSSWARGTIVPLLIVIAERPTVELPSDKNIPELFPRNWTYEEEDNSRSFFSWSNFFSFTDRLLKLYVKFPWQPGRKKAEKKCVDWIVERQEADGSWGGIQPPWVYSLIALDTMDYSLDHPVMKKGLEGFNEFARESENEWWLQACVSPVWDTAWAVISLIESGLIADHKSINSAVDWLLEQEIRQKGDWAVSAEPVDLGGWAFEFENENYPDIDDVAEVLIALDLSSGRERDKSAAIDRGIKWLFAMQSDNGGWGAFDTNNDRELIYKIPFADFGAVIDPPSVDVTAHVVELLGRFGFEFKDPPVARALDYIKSEQLDDGSWFGRWGINYVYGIGTVLPALEAVGVDMEASYVRKAVNWLVDHQNDDGGWGETAASYDNPNLAGQGPSTPSQTAWSILGLVAAGEEDHPATDRGVDFLLGLQTDDWTWEEKQFTGTGFPGDFYLRYEMYSHYFPLLALGRYREIKEMSKAG